jgi:hypothetical protein
MTWRGKPLDELEPGEVAAAIARLRAYRFADTAVRRRFVDALQGRH